MTGQDSATRARLQYDAYAVAYDRETSWYERIMFGDGRAWAGRHARGEVLEVAIGTGRNLPFYPSTTRLVGLDLSAGMLGYAHRRALALGISVDLVQADAQSMPFADATFDTVVCTLGLSSIPDDRAAVQEMHRVLRSGGRLVAPPTPRPGRSCRCWKRPPSRSPTTAEPVAESFNGSSPPSRNGGPNPAGTLGVGRPGISE